jgi:hypothetical protein
VIADRARLAEIKLNWRTGTIHSPEELARMREVCHDIRTALEAMGNPTTHPLRGIEQTKWNPAWAQALQQYVDRLQAALNELKAAVNLVIKSISLEQVSIDDRMLPQLLKLVSMMLHVDAADGVLLLTNKGPEHVRALKNLASAVGRFNAKQAGLSVKYDLKATHLDLKELQREWAAASGSNVIVRGSRKKKVRLALKPYCATDVPNEIDRDLTLLQDLATILGEIEMIRPRFGGIERLWRGVSSDVGRFDGLIGWAAGTRDAVIKHALEN